MARQLQMAAQFPPISLLAPAADAAGRTSAYLSARNAVAKIWIVAEVNQGNAATVALSILQAKDNAGTSSKAINASAAIWADQDTATIDTFVAQTAAASFTTSATLKNKLVIFELVPERDFDLANGFNHFALSTGASNAANITRAEAFLWGAYQQATPPTANI